MKMAVRKLVLFMVLSSFVVSFGLQSSFAEDYWPLSIYLSPRRGVNVNYMGKLFNSYSNEWVGESWIIPIDFTGQTKDVEHITIQNGDPTLSVSDVILVIALTPQAKSAISKIEVSPSNESSKLSSDFTRADALHVPRGYEFGKHIYQEGTDKKCYYYEFHICNFLGWKGTYVDDIDITVTTYVDSGIRDCTHMWVHFDASAILTSDPPRVVSSPSNRDTCMWQSIVQVVPEIPWGTIAAAVTPFLALGVFLKFKRHKLKTQLQR